MLLLYADALYNTCRYLQYPFVFLYLVSEIVICINPQKEKHPLSFHMIYNHIDEPKKNLQKLNVEAVKKFGQELGSSYYKVLKKHVKIMSKL